MAIPGVQESKVMASFLSESSDPSLFMPDSVGDKAGKMIKSVPNMLTGKDVSIDFGLSFANSSSQGYRHLPR